MAPPFYWEPLHLMSEMLSFEFVPRLEQLCESCWSRMDSDLRAVIWQHGFDGDYYVKIYDKGGTILQSFFSESKKPLRAMLKSLDFMELGTKDPQVLLAQIFSK